MDKINKKSRYNFDDSFILSIKNEIKIA